MNTEQELVKMVLGNSERLVQVQELLNILTQWSIQQSFSDRKFIDGILEILEELVPPETAAVLAEARAERQQDPALIQAIRDKAAKLETVLDQLTANIASLRGKLAAPPIF
jgi:hypothetical protein